METEETQETGGSLAHGEGTPAVPPATEAEPGWWRRDHPTFTSLAGFFTGLLFVILVPGAWAAVLNLVTDNDTAQELFPLVLVALVVPIGLLLVPRTRRFGRYMVVGILTTAVVVLGTAGLVLWYLYSADG